MAGEFTPTVKPHYLFAKENGDGTVYVGNCPTVYMIQREKSM
jgi:hypothetical protein